MFIFSLKRWWSWSYKRLFWWALHTITYQDFNTLIDNKPFFDQPVKIKQEAYEKLVEMSRNSYYTTGSLLDCLYHQKYFNLICIDLSRQTNTSIPQEINFTGKLEDDKATMFIIAEKQQKTILNISLDSLILRKK